MKNILFILSIAMLMGLPDFSFAQNINWRSLDSNNKHIINLNTGWDYAFTVGLGYGYKFKTKIPLVASGEYSFPLGNKLFDDFKAKAGLQAEVLHVNNFSVTAKAYGIFRQYNSPLVRMDNFGSDLSLVAGYYKPKWYAAAEFGFDKAITTYVKNSELMIENNPEVQNGWYIPTGGNFYYGIQAGTSFSNSDLSLKIGRTVTQDFKTTAAIPWYLQLGYNFRL